MSQMMLLGCGSSGGGDSTPGGASDVWMWEDGIGMQWEAGIFMTIE